MNVLLYLDDRKNRDSVLHNVAKKRDELQEHMASPEPEKREIPVGTDQENMFVGDTKFEEVVEKDGNKLGVKESTTSMTKDALKRSVARISLAK